MRSFERLAGRHLAFRSRHVVVDPGFGLMGVRKGGRLLPIPVIWSSVAWGDADAALPESGGMQEEACGGGDGDDHQGIQAVPAQGDQQNHAKPEGKQVQFS